MSLLRRLGSAFSAVGHHQHPHSLQLTARRYQSSSSSLQSIAAAVVQLGATVYQEVQHTISHPPRALTQPLTRQPIQQQLLTPITQQQQHGSDDDVRQTERQQQQQWLDYHSANYHPLSPLQHTVLLPLASLGASLNTYRGDLVAAVGELLPGTEKRLQLIYDRMLESEEGQHILRTKPRIYSDHPLWSFDNLQHYKPNTLGRVYYDFMHGHGYTSDERTSVRFIADSELAYVIQRYREVHDLWHLLLGLDTTVVEEIAQKYFEYQVTGLPLGYASYAYAPLKLSSEEQQLLSNTYIPQLQQVSHECADLMSICYEDYLSEDIDVLRQKWKLKKISKG